MTIALGGILIAAGVFAFSDFNDENPIANSDAPQWTQNAGEGISVPACGSSNASAPTCDGTLPSVTFDWNLDTAFAIEDIQLIINGPSGEVFNKFICGDGTFGSCNKHIGSWPWTDGALDTNYSWLLYEHHTSVVDPLIGSGTFRTPVTCPSSNPPPIGYHDSSTCTASFGWACDASDYNQPLQIHFYGDGPAGSGTFLGAATADIAAEAGVASACGGNANHRFQFNTPDSLKNGLNHDIYAYALDIPGGAGNPLLTGSPKTINCAPPVVNDASCGPIAIPPSVTAGQSFPASVTMNNTGTKPWTDPSYDLIPVTSPGVWAPTLWGIGGVDLPFSPVNQNQSALFSFNATAPSAPNTYDFSWQMIEQSVGTFGPMCTQQIQVNPPNMTISGRVFNETTGLGFGGASIETCRGFPVSTDANGNFSFQVPQQDGFCARVSPEVRAGLDGPFLNNNAGLEWAKTYEYQVAGWHCASQGGCSPEQVIWDRPTDGTFDFKYRELGSPTVICSASPPTINAGESTTWTATASGGSGTYNNFDWTDTAGNTKANNGSTNPNGWGPIFYAADANATVFVIDSNNKPASYSCSVTVNPPQPTGDLEVKRVGVDLLTTSIPATTAEVIGVGQKTANPAPFNGLDVGSYTVRATDLAGYTAMYGTCNLPGCTVASFPSTPACSGGWCSAGSQTVSDSVLTRVVFQYVVTVTLNPPVAVATISKDGVSYTDSIAVTQGVPTTIFLAATGSSDPDGWTDPTNGVSNGGRCEWNADLDQDTSAWSSRVDQTVFSPASPDACNIPLGVLTFNDVPGTYIYDALRIVDTPGATSNIDTVTVVVQAPSLQGDLEVKRVGVDLLTTSIPATTAEVVTVGQKPENPAFFYGLDVGSYTVRATDLAGYTEMYETCNLPGCTVASFPSTPACSGGWCSAGSQTVSDGVLTRVVFQYLVAPPPPPSCTATPPSVLVGQQTILSASGGDGTYSWDIPDGTPPSGTGPSIPTSYSTAGFKTVTVTSAGQNGSCNVDVTSGGSLYQCNDGVDNSDPEDTIADYPNDIGCISPTDNDERNRCVDGIDNDNDGTVDNEDSPYLAGRPDDPGCSSLRDNTEANPPIFEEIPPS